MRRNFVCLQETKTEKQTRRKRKDTARYRKRKAIKAQLIKAEMAKAMILNKSAVTLNDNDNLLLWHGLKFATTPNWTENISKTEWCNHFQHIRRLEWNDYHQLKNDEGKSTARELPKN